jgi:hypothetical protein
MKLTVKFDLAKQALLGFGFDPKEFVTWDMIVIALEMAARQLLWTCVGPRDQEIAEIIVDYNIDTQLVEVARNSMFQNDALPYGVIALAIEDAKFMRSMIRNQNIAQQQMAQAQSEQIAARIAANGGPKKSRIIH